MHMNGFLLRPKRSYKKPFAGLAPPGPAGELIGLQRSPKSPSCFRGKGRAGGQDGKERGVEGTGRDRKMKGKRKEKDGRREKDEKGRERREGRGEEGSGPLICQNVAAPLPQGQKLGVSGHRGQH